MWMLLCLHREATGILLSPQGAVSSSKWSLIKYNIAIYHEILGFSHVKSYAYFMLLFLPTYFAKVAKMRRDSKLLREKWGRGK